jgi:hypothetical protein
MVGKELWVYQTKKNPMCRCRLLLVKNWVTCVCVCVWDQGGGSRVMRGGVVPMAWKKRQLACSMGLEWRASSHPCTMGNHSKKGFFAVEITYILILYSVLYYI